MSETQIEIEYLEKDLHLALEERDQYKRQVEEMESRVERYMLRNAYLYNEITKLK